MTENSLKFLFYNLIQNNIRIYFEFFHLFFFFLNYSYYYSHMVEVANILNIWIVEKLTKLLHQKLCKFVMRLFSTFMNSSHDSISIIWYANFCLNESIKNISFFLVYRFLRSTILIIYLNSMRECVTFRDLK